MATATGAQTLGLTNEQREFYRTQGYLIIRKLWSPEEIRELREVIDGLAESGKPIPSYWEPQLRPDGSNDPDPLKRYPRMLQLHRHQPIGCRCRQRDDLKVDAGDRPAPRHGLIAYPVPGGVTGPYTSP